MSNVTNISDPIPMLDLRSEVEGLWDEVASAVDRVLRSGQYIGGPEVHQFEQEVADFLGVEHAVSVNSGTDALVIGLRAAGVGPGDEVITTPYTFFATVEAIVHVGARPVFVDIAKDGFNIDVAAIDTAVTERTKAVLPVHLFGEPVPLAPLLEVARARGLIVVEDCAQAFGATYPGSNPGIGAGSQRVGSGGHVAAFSFYPTKNLGAYGDGGLVATNDGVIAETARRLRNHASDPTSKYVHRDIGYNSRLDELQAAVLRVKLPYVDAWNQRRREVARRYGGLLVGMPELVLPRVSPGHVFHQYTVRARPELRDALRVRLAEEGIGTSVFYPPAVDAWPEAVADGAQACFRAAAASREVLSLPIFPQLSERQQKRVADVVSTHLR